MYFRQESKSTKASLFSLTFCDTLATTISKGVPAKTQSRKAAKTEKEKRLLVDSLLVLISFPDQFPE